MIGGVPGSVRQLIMEAMPLTPTRAAAAPPPPPLRSPPPPAPRGKSDSGGADECEGLTSAPHASPPAPPAAGAAGGGRGMSKTSPAAAADGSSPALDGPGTSANGDGDEGSTAAPPPPLALGDGGGDTPAVVDAAMSDPRRLVGARIRVHWAIDRAWFLGVVDEYNGALLGGERVGGLLSACACACAYEFMWLLVITCVSLQRSTTCTT